MICPDPAQWRTNCRTRGEWFDTVLLHGFCLLNVPNIIYSSLMIITQTPNSHEECDRSSTPELWTNLESLNHRKTFICSSLSLWVEDPPALLASIPWNPTPIKVQFSSFGPNNEGEALSSIDHQMNVRHGTHSLVTSSRGLGHKQRYYLPTKTLFSLRRQLTSALHYASLAKIYLLLLLHLRLHLLAPCPVSWFNFLLCQAKHQMFLACLRQGIKSPLSFCTFQLLSLGIPLLSLWSRWKLIVVISGICRNDSHLLNS